MALHISSLSHQAISNPYSTRTRISTTRSLRRIELGSGHSDSNKGNSYYYSNNNNNGVGLKCVVRANLESVETHQSENLVGKVTEVNKDTFWPIVNAAQDKTVVLDMYTQWCGPCKVMAPKFEKLAQEKLDVIFLKLDCNQENKPLAKELGIRVVPTFKILKDSKIVKEITGAKFDELADAIEKCCAGTS